MDALIVSTARTPLTRSFRGSFNLTHPVTMGAHVAGHAIQRAGIDPALVEDVILGGAFIEGPSGMNIARVVALRAGLPVSTCGLTINRFCSTGLQAIALASQRILSGEGEVYLAGGIESITLCQGQANTFNVQEDWVATNVPATYWSMLDTAETVAKRYDIPRDAQDNYGLGSQLRAAAARASGKFAAEIAPMTTTMVAERPDGSLATMQVTASEDEGIRPDTTIEALAKIKPVLPGG